MSISQAAPIFLASDDTCGGSHPGPPLPPGAALKLAHQLDAAADPARLRILSFVLSQDRGRSSACDINDDVHTVFRLPASAVGRHLQVLREAGLLDVHEQNAHLFFQATSEGRELLARLRRSLGVVPAIRERHQPHTEVPEPQSPGGQQACSVTCKSDSALPMRVESAR
ncbi:winged helix-turn-helix domain-containing protein [Nonomuraea sp. NPDC048882]|uniref:ArsR/SmtB family transcription factor n=1 Tax=unclassified Nonomuraea TaxID=2593643 RepID=UPI0033C7C726